MTHNPSMKRSEELIALEKQYLAPNYKPLDVVIAKGEGVSVEDVDGNRYMDFLAAYSALNQGYMHPRIKAAMIDQLDKVALTSRAFRNDQLPLLAKELCDMTGFEMMLPMNTGAEAVETAIKAARKWGYKVKGVEDGKQEIIVCDDNFHGRTVTIVSFSTEEDYKEGFRPFTPGFISIPYGDAKALEDAITENTVAFMFEPIQGEAGVRIPPDGFIKDVRRICDENNMLMIADEIQSGLGRTGKMFAFEWEEVRPDMVTIGKALSGGFYPVSAVLASKAILSLFGPGQHGSTYGGNPLGCRIAREAMAVLVEEKLVERSAEMGVAFLERLKAIDSPHVAAVRGRGLWFAIDLKPEAGGARRFAEALMEKGLLVKETHTHTLRLAPPLTITQEELDWAFDRLCEVLCECEEENHGGGCGGGCCCCG